MAETADTTDTTTGTAADTTETENPVLEHVVVGGKTYDCCRQKKGYTLTVETTWGDSTDDRLCLLWLVFANGVNLPVSLFYETGDATLVRTHTFENVLAYKSDSYFTHIQSNIFGSLVRTYFCSDIIEVLPSWPDGYTWLTEDTKISMNYTYYCLAGGTQVLLSDGSGKAIEDLTYDDDLKVWDFDEGRVSHAKPTFIKKAETAQYFYRSRYASGRVLDTVGRHGHRHFDIDESDFAYPTRTVGDEVMTDDGPDRHVSCERVDRPCEFYNVITERHFNLFANGVLTSCRLNNFRRIENMRFSGDHGGLCIGRSEFSEALARLGGTRADRWFDTLRIGEMPRGRTDELAEYVMRLERTMK